MNQLLAKISQLMGHSDHKKDEIDVSALSCSTAAVPSPEEPDPLHPGKRRVKENYTSHWDLDYLPVEEAEKAMGYTQPSNSTGQKQGKK